MARKVKERKGVSKDLYASDPSVITQEQGESWVLYNGDSCSVLPGLPDKSIDLSVFSPPFKSLFTYSDSPKDVGNCATTDEFLNHFRFIVCELLRLMKPGRNVCVHIQNVVTTHTTDGVRGIDNIMWQIATMFKEVGFAHCGEIPIDKNPQMQAARNKVHELMFATKNRDATMLVPVMVEYIMVFKAPGKNAVPVVSPIDNETWIDWAHGIWPEDGRPRNPKAKNPKFPYVDNEDWRPAILPFYDIRETDVLNTSTAKDNLDERHMCPLALGLIARLIKLYTNEGETVLDPFDGIGSTVHEAIRLGRRGIGVELKPSYHRCAVKNVRNAQCSNLSLGLFDDVETEEVEDEAVAV